jgi:hypothetical protein
MSNEGLRMSNEGGGSSVSEAEIEVEVTSVAEVAML